MYRRKLLPSIDRWSPPLYGEMKRHTTALLRYSYLSNVVRIQI